MYCVIDIGSNTIRLVIYRIEGRMIRPILNNKKTVGLAGYVDKRNCLSKEGIHRLIDVLREFTEVISLLPDCPVYPFATASLRNVANTEQILEAVWRETGLGIQVLSGHEEAMLDYRGALRHMSMESGLLIDVGGGSTELVFFKERTVLAAHSIPLGSLNLYRSYVESIVPKKAELQAMRHKVQSCLNAVMPPETVDISYPICGVGGTARAAQALHDHLYPDSASKHQYDALFLREMRCLSEKKPRKLMRQILKVAPDRVHTLLPGMVILQSAAELYDISRIRTSPYGVREGYLSFILEKEGILCD